MTEEQYSKAVNFLSTETWTLVCACLLNRQRERMSALTTPDLSERASDFCRGEIATLHKIISGEIKNMLTVAFEDEREVEVEQEEIEEDVS